MARLTTSFKYVYYTFFMDCAINIMLIVGSFLFFTISLIIIFITVMKDNCGRRSVLIHSCDLLSEIKSYLSKPNDTIVMCLWRCDLRFLGDISDPRVTKEKSYLFYWFNSFNIKAIKKGGRNKLFTLFWLISNSISKTKESAK